MISNALVYESRFIDAPVTLDGSALYINPTKRPGWRNELLRCVSQLPYGVNAFFAYTALTAIAEIEGRPAWDEGGKAR